MGLSGSAAITHNPTGHPGAGRGVAQCPGLHGRGVPPARGYDGPVSRAPAISVGDTVPGFVLPLTDGRTVDLSDLPGAQAIAVVFWCNHCPYVNAWLGRLNDLAEELADRGLVVICVNSNDAVTYPADSFDAMVERVRQTGTVFRYAHDETQDVARAYGAERTPEVFLLDADRRLRYRGAIDDSTEPGGVTQQWLHDAALAVLRGQDVAVTETPAVGCSVKWRH
ncbi:MAG: thioredoxin family protein [Actinobacteria bacterium]|nr:thioredoxin family protein [Actinomycetota bacterium]MBM3697219.1 thioredoxin family protein [Actinomycetota bacterium]